MSDLGILVPITALAIPIVAIWSRHKQRLAEIVSRNNTGASADTTAQLARQTAELEERVRVLERIVTDGNYNLASQIEALRSVDTPTGTPAHLGVHLGKH
jgi:hypothetical protein